MADKNLIPEDVEDSLKDAKADIEDAAGKAKSAAKSKAKKLKDDVNDAVDDAQEALEDETSPSALETFMEQQRKALSETRKALESLIPEAFREHSATAVNEAVEGYRTLFNTMIDEINDNVKKVTHRFEKEAEDVAEKVEIEED